MIMNLIGMTTGIMTIIVLISDVRRCLNELFNGYSSIL